MSCYDGDGPSCSTVIMRRARKEHECCACDLPIRRGDRYRYLSGIWDGCARSFKQCARCAMTFDWLTDHTSDPVAVALDCGHEYEGDDPFMHALAFMTPDEAQAALAATPPQPVQGETKP